MGTSDVVRRSAVIFAGLGLAATLAGCSPGDVELKGRIFEMTGLDKMGQHEEVKMPERPPLVVPPKQTMAELPPPGKPQGAAEVPQNWPIDHDKFAKTDEERKQEAELERCRNPWGKKNMDAQDFEAAATGGNCKGILSTMFSRDADKPDKADN